MAVLPMHEIGIDIIEIDRVGAALSRWGERFERRVYTDAVGWRNNMREGLSGVNSAPVAPFVF